MTRYSLTLAVSVLASFALGACTSEKTVLIDSSSGSITAAVADANRPDADKQRDANRKPAATLEFLGVHPGEQDAELLPGGGYFTRLFQQGCGDRPAMSTHWCRNLPLPFRTEWRTCWIFFAGAVV